MGKSKAKRRGTRLPAKPDKRRKLDFLPPLLLVLLTIGAMGNGLNGAPIFDDVYEIINNPNIHSPSPWWKPLTGGNELPARPLPYLSFAVDYRLWGSSFVGFHVTNIIIHCVAALCLFGVVRRTLRSSALRERFGQHASSLAFLIAALWAVHPLQTQAVTYVYQRIESMMGMFFLLSLYLFVRGTSGASPRPWLAGSVLACAAAMACKEVAVVLPIIIFLYDRTFVETSFREVLRQRRAYYSGLAATWAILAMATLSQGDGGILAASGVAKSLTQSATTPFTYLLSQPEVILHYLRLAVWPAGQCLDLAWPLSEGWLRLFPSLAVVASLVLLSIWALLRGHPLGWLGFAFFLILAPTSSVLPMKDLANEHRMYLPLAAVLAAVVLAGYAACQQATALDPRRRKMVLPGASILAAAAVLALATTTVQRNKLYASPTEMWRGVSNKAPANDRAWSQLSIGHYADGDVPAAAEAGRRAVSLNPGNVRAHANLANALLELGHTHEAVGHLKMAISSPTDLPPPGLYLALATLMADGDPAYSESIFQQALAHYPNDLATLNNVANFYAKNGRFDEAIKLYQLALRLQPGDPRVLQNLHTAEGQRMFSRP